MKQKYMKYWYKKLVNFSNGFWRLLFDADNSKNTIILIQLEYRLVISPPPDIYFAYWRDDNVDVTLRNVDGRYVAEVFNHDSYIRAVILWWFYHARFSPVNCPAQIKKIYNCYRASLKCYYIFSKLLSVTPINIKWRLTSIRKQHEKSLLQLLGTNSLRLKRLKMNCIMSGSCIFSKE